MDLQRHPCISAASHQNLKTAVFLVFPAVTAAVQHLVKPTPRSASRSAATTPQPPPSQTTSPRPVASPGRPLGSTRGKETSQGRRVRAGVPEGITEVDGKGKKKVEEWKEKRSASSLVRLCYLRRSGPLALLLQENEMRAKMSEAN